MTWHPHPFPIPTIPKEPLHETVPYPRRHRPAQRRRHGARRRQLHRQPEGRRCAQHLCEEIQRRDALQFVTEDKRQSLLKKIHSSGKLEAFPTYKVEKELESVLDQLLGDEKMQSLIVAKIKQRFSKRDQ